MASAAHRLHITALESELGLAKIFRAVLPSKREAKSREHLVKKCRGCRAISSLTVCPVFMERRFFWCLWKLLIEVCNFKFVKMLVLTISDVWDYRLYFKVNADEINSSCHVQILRKMKLLKKYCFQFTVWSRGCVFRFHVVIIID
jgi:hypothetical protein